MYITQYTCIILINIVYSYAIHTAPIYMSYTTHPLYPYTLQVISVETEEELLLRWKEFVCACDPDVITGYNIG